MPTRWAAAGLAVHVTHVHSVGDVGPCLDDLAAAVGASVASLPSPPAPAASTRPRHMASLGSQTTWSGGRGAAGVRPDLATAVDDDERRHLRVVDAGRPGHRERVRRRDRALPDDDARRRQPPGSPIWCWRRPSPTRSRTATSVELRTVAPDARLVDGQDLFWWGVRTPAALERLAQALGS